MKQVLILENNDQVDSEDWCRPLHLINNGYSTTVSTKNEFSGTPENFLKWVKVKYIFHSGYYGKTVDEINNTFKRWGLEYEFVRGIVPQNHELNLKSYNIIDLSKVKEK